jgi:X-X-X-Leu-X-X-Gly heptad repeat protein
LDNIETFTASLDTTFEEIASGTHTLVSGSSQVTSGAASGEVLYKNASDNTIDGSAIYSDGTDLISIGTATGNVGDLASGNQLSLYGSSISGLLSFDISGTSKSFDYVASDFRYVDTNAGVGIVLKPNADANKAWIIDTDGDLVSNSNNASVTGSIYAANVVARGDISGSNLLLTGNANIDGDITLGGNITIGDGSADSLTINADIESDIRPNADNTYDLGATTLRYAEIHGTNIYGAINATNGVISGSAQLLNVATDFGSGRVSGDNFGDLDGGSTITGSFVGDGSGITGLSTTISVSGSDGSNDTVSLLDGAITFDGGTGVSTAVATDTVTISVQDASTSAKGIASFSSDDFSVSSGDVTLKAGNGVDSSGGVRGANLNADTAGDGLSYSLSNQQLDVDYGSTANTAVEGNTTATFTGTANEITVSDSSAQALGGGIAVTISLPDDVTIGNDLTVTTDASVGGNLSVTGNLSVLGTTTTVDSTTVQIGDNILELNVGGAQTDAGLLVTDTQAPNTASGSLVWDGTNDYWKAGALGSEKEIALLNAAPTTNTVLKADSNGLLVDSVLTDDGTDATFSGDVIVSGLSVGSNGGFLYVDTSNQLNSATATNAGDVIQWDGSSFVASNELDGGTF